jgi:hypothetical protein
VLYIVIAENQTLAVRQQLYAKLSTRTSPHITVYAIIFANHEEVEDHLAERVRRMPSIGMFSTQMLSSYKFK